MNELGRFVYGFRWRSSSFHSDDEEAQGSPEERALLLSTCLRAAMQIAVERDREKRCEAKSSSVAFSACLHFVAEVTSIVTTVFLFWEKQTWQAWTFVSIWIATRLFQFGTLIFLQKSKWTDFLGALLGITVITDAYRVLRQKTNYDRPPGKMGLGIVAAIRIYGTAIIQFIPQNILNISIIIRMLERREKMGGLFWVQLISVGSSVLSFGLSLSKYDTDFMKKHEKRKIYLSMCTYMPLDSKQGEREAIVVLKTLWYMMHILCVSTGVGTLIGLAPVRVSMSIIGGFLLVVNVLRAIVNKGELRFYKRLKPTLVNNFISVFGALFLYCVGGSIMPLSIIRLHGALGPSVYGFVWVVSFSMSVGVVYWYARNVAFLVLFGVLCALYIVTVMMFLSVCRGKTWKTFFFSTENWKDVLRGELWEDWNFGSLYWRNEFLLNDEDAHYAGLVSQYLDSDLPWDKLKVWLMSKKNNFLFDPPLWLTEKWLSLVPDTIRDEIWTSGELRELKDSITQAKENVRRVVNSRTMEIVTMSNKAYNEAMNGSSQTHIAEKGTENAISMVQIDQSNSDGLTFLKTLL
eukprot:g909.t1